MTGAQHDHVPDPAPTPWQQLAPEGKAEAVRALVEIAGKTYTQAATLLGTTRVAIAGVIERQKKRKPIVSNSGQRYGGDTRKDQKGGKAFAKRVAGNKGRAAAKPKHAGFHKFVALALPPVIIAEPAGRADAWQALPGSSPVPLEAHRDGCRFPTGEDRPFLSCNLPVKNGSVYCPVHDELCYRDPPVRRGIRKDSR